jgi:hypothetical protein
MNIFTPVHEINTAGASALINSLKAEAPVVLAGSAISIWKPSEMPSGQEFTASLFAALFDPSFPLLPEEEPAIRTLFADMPFEHVLEVCPEPDAASQLIIELYGKSTPNPIHEALARALSQNHLSSLITTNYDCCLETAISQLNHRTQKIVTIDDFSRAVGNEKIYFKIHGSIEPGLEQTAIRTLSEESLLPKWKRNLLTRLLSNRTLVLLGYSGRDFELCPELARMPLKQLVWIARTPEPPSVNARALLKHVKGQILYGDMNAVLGEWLSSNPASISVTGTTAGEAIQRYFSRDVLSAWRLAILIRIGAPIMALRTVQSPGYNMDKLLRQRQMAHAEIAAGLYRRAAWRFLRASFKAGVVNGRCSLVDVLLDTSDALRIFGALGRSWLSFAVAALFACRSNRSKVLLKLALLIDSLQRSISIKALHPFRVSLYKRLANVLKKCATEALANGNWLDFQQTGLIAKRTGIPLSELGEGDFYPPPDPQDGYQQLGYFLAQSMTVLDNVASRPPQQCSHAELLEMRQTLETQFRLCSVLGIAPQCWKLRAAGKEYFNLDHSGESKYIAQMLKDFHACEYTALIQRYWRRRFPVLDSALNMPHNEKTL